MSNERSNSNSRGDDHRVSLSYPPGRKARGALHHSQSNRSLAVVAAAVALLCLSSPSQQLQLRHHHRHGHGDGHGYGVVLASASSKHVPPPSRSFLGIRSSSRTQPPCRGGNSNNNSNNNINPNTNTPQSLPRCRSDLATGHSRSVLRFSATPDEEPEYEQQREQDQERDSDRSSASSSSFNTTSLSSSTSTYIGGKSGIEEDDDDEDESRVTTTSFFELPSAAHQEPQELPGSSADDRRRRPIFSFRRQDSAVFAVQKLKQKQKKQQQQQQQQLLPQQIQNRFVWSLMGIAGFVEGFCIRQYGCFPNLMTGTILKLAEAVGSLNLSTAGFYASMVLAYMAGGSIVAMWKSSPQYRSSGGGGGGNSNSNTNNGVDPKRSLLEGVSVLSAMCFVVSDLASASTIARASVLKLPLLATAFGIVNAGTMDAGAGVTNAMTGHVSKIGQGLVNSSGIGGGIGIGGGSPHLASAKGMGIFWAAAVLSNLVCAAIEIEAGSITGGHHHAFALATTTAARWLSAKVPLGTTLAVVYGMLFRWYLGASAKAAKAAAAEKTKIA
eukprot:jgi/Psemu1/284720/fgenesh1_pg.62_\